MHTYMYEELRKSNMYKLFKPFKPMRYPRNWWDNLRWFFRSFKLAAQRIKRGYSDYDLCDFGDYMTRMAACGLEDFRNKTDGYPGTLTPEEWNHMLENASANLFLSIDELTDFNYCKPEMPGELKIVEKENGELTMSHIGATDEEIKVWMETINAIDKDAVERGREGWEWFSKWYQHIWY